MKKSKHFSQYSLAHRLLSVVLVFLLAGSTLLESTAAIASEVLTPIPLATARLNDIPEGNYLYFGTAAATVDEADSAYSVTIYREGDLQNEATVELHTTDLSATYGKDYVLMLPNTEKIGDGKTVLEKYLGDLDSYEAQLNPEESDYYLIGEEEMADDETTEETYTVLDNSDGITAAISNKSALALLKEEQTGEETRDLYETQSQDAIDAIVQELIPQALEQIGYSSTTVLTFAVGESEKTIAFRIKDDNKSEGTETFNLRLSNAVGADIYQVAALSVAINDDEPLVHSTVSFAKDSYNAEDGTVTVTIKRNGADYSLIDMRLLSSEDTAKAGENYTEVNEILSFAPYEMEKEITLKVNGEGSFSLLLTELTACEAGKYTKTKINILPTDNDSASATYSNLRTANRAASASSSFAITVNGKNYTVEYTPGESSGKIMDNSYDPAIEAGVYYFSLPLDRGGLFKYGVDSYSSGDKPSSLGTLKSEYIDKDDDDHTLAQHQSYGKIEYYSLRTWDKGQVWTSAKYNSMPGVYFQLVAPDWESTSSTYGGQAFNINSSALGVPSSWAYGKFDRTQDNAALVLKNIQSTQYNRKFHVSVNSVDQEANKTPKCYMRFYGIACLYKKYEVSVNEPAKMQYQTGIGSTISAVPAQATIKCGAVTANTNSRYIFANTDTNKSNIVFNLDTSLVNGMNEKFGTLTGYTITIGAGEGKTVTKKYPEDFIAYLNSTTSEGDDFVKYDTDSVNKEINKITQSLETVPADGYFVDWIDSLQKEVFSDGKGYYQKLTFTPQFKYIEMPITVLAPSVSATDGENAAQAGYFNDKTLKNIGNYTYHAGDVLHLDATCNLGGYHIAGYQVSTDNGTTWDSITSTEYLKLEPKNAINGYYIRPLLVENTNCIQIVCSGGVADKVLGVDYQGLVSDNLLKEVDLSGKYILRLNDGTDALSQMRPTVGQIYAINFRPYTTGATTYYPVITDSQGNKYSTQTLYYTAKQTALDNVLTLSYEDRATLNEYTITGRLMSNYLPIVSTATENKHLGISGYTVSLAAGTANTANSSLIETISTTSDYNGNFTLSGIYGKAGDVLTMLVSNGADTQIVKVTLGSNDSLNVGNVYLSYPNNAPYVANLMYSYNKAINDNKADNTSNSIEIYDDTINITAVVNALDHNVTKAEFTVYTVNAANGEPGSESVYVVKATDNSGIFTLSIPHMTENLHNGDHIRVRLVSETTVNGESYEHYYPAVETGYVFKTQNALAMPQSYNTTKTPTVNIPILGASNASSSSGLLSFTRTDWGNNTGYTLSVNIDALCYATTTPSTADKLEKYDKLQALSQNAYDLKKKADEKGEQLSDLNAYAGYLATELEMEDIVEPEMYDELETVEGQIQVAQGQLDRINAAGKQAKNAVASYSDATIMKVDVLFLLAFDFAYVPGAIDATTGEATTGEYVFCSGAVSAGGSVNYSKSAYFVFYGVPMYLNITGFMQGDLTVYYPAGVNAITAAAFEAYSGNIAERINTTTANMTLAFQLKGSVGAGMCNVLGAGGAVTFKLQYNVPIVDSDNYGVLISGAGSIYADVLVGRIELTLLTGTLGFGTYEKKTDFDLFGGAYSANNGTLFAERQLMSNESTIDESQSNLSFQNYQAGTADMVDFGGNGFIQATPGEIKRTVLLDDAGERTAPQIIELDNGDKMIFFIGSRNHSDELSKRALYYAICHNGYWSTPQIVADDGTFDAKPTVLQHEGKVIVAWVDADGTANSTSTIIEQLNSLGISLAIYTDGVWSEEVNLVQDEFFNFAPQLNVIDDTLYCSYMKRDISQVTNTDQLLDYTNTYSTMAYVHYDLDGHKVRTGGKENYITILHPTLKDPLVLDYQCFITQIEGEDYMLATYTVDEDLDLNTHEDREIFLSITNLTTSHSYYPIKLTNDFINQANPKLTDLDGICYLSWLENGYLFNLLNVTEIVQAFFYNEAVGDIYRSAKDNEQTWYQKDAHDLGLDKEDYTGSFYDLANKGLFKAEQANFQMTDNATGSIGDYKLVTNGDDIYIFYTDFGSDDPEDLSLELYGVRYQRDMSQDETEEKWGFGKAVKITDYGKVIDEFDLFMTNDDKISLVSNHYSQWIDDNGLTKQGQNQIIEIDFAPKGSVSILNDKVALPRYLVGGSKGHIDFTVVNDGLLSTKAFNVQVAEIKNNATNVIYDETITMDLDSGESYDMQIPWTISADLSATKIKVTVNESAVTISNPTSVTVSAPYRSNVIFNEPIAQWDGERCIFTATAFNMGNQAAPDYTAQICLANGTDAKKVYASAEIPALASGESAKIEISFKPTVDDFSDLGVLKLMIRAMDGDKQISCAYSKLVPAKPIIAAINGGAGKVDLAIGKTTQLKVTAAPWGDLVGQASFSSNDPSIVSVDENGVIKAVKAGSTVITAYYAGGAKADIVVNVAGNSPGSDSGADSYIPPSDSNSNIPDEKPNSTVFTDVDANAYYAEAVNWAVANSITSGAGHNLFAPDMACNRAQIVSFLWRAAGAPEPKNTVNPFSDVSNDAYYLQAMLWAIENGITVGTSATTFSPDAICTREQAVTFIYRYEKAQGGGFSGAWMFRLPFSDVTAENYETVAWCYMNKITGGVSDTLFAPNADCTRGQIVTFLYRYANCDN